MSTLYGDNTLPRFWRLESEVPSEAWQAAMSAAVRVLPDGAGVLGQSGWSGLMDHILGERQFGPTCHRLSRFKRLYYTVRPVLPRWIGAVARRRYRGTQQRGYPLMWPIEDRYVRFVYQVLDHVADRTRTRVPSPSTPSRQPSETRRLGFWPDGARFAFVLTHDVDTAAGQGFARALADLDERYGFRASFNFVAEDYRVNHSLLDELRARGFEVGLHGLRHDGKLFSSRGAFERSAERINYYLREWSAVGFRSPSMHRHPEWMQALEVEYDASFFDTDPYEPMAGGTMSIWPFFCGNFVELPYTLVQDHTLLTILGERTPRIWLDKVDFIARWGGMALVNVHPDYMRERDHLAVYEKFLEQMTERMKNGQGKGDGEAALHPRGWHTLPREIARWWRVRAEVPWSSAGALGLTEEIVRGPLQPSSLSSASACGRRSWGGRLAVPFRTFPGAGGGR